jgi:hypothetical protein
MTANLVTSLVKIIEMKAILVTNVGACFLTVGRFLIDQFFVVSFFKGEFYDP